MAAAVGSPSNVNFWEIKASPRAASMLEVPGRFFDNLSQAVRVFLDNSARFLCARWLKRIFLFPLIGFSLENGLKAALDHQR